MNRKKISLTAALIAFTVALSGCSNVSEENNVPSVPESTESVSDEYTDTSPLLSAPSETVGTTPEVSVSESDTDTLLSETDDETASSELSEETSDSSESISEEISETTSLTRTWSETNSTGVMYVVADCVGREGADDSSTIITKFTKGDKVEISALTDSGFYKIKGGGYIHLEYLSDNPVTETTTETETLPETEETSEVSTTKKKPVTTSVSESETEAVTELDDTLSVNAGRKYTDRYAYKQLSDTEKTLYKDIYNAVNNFEQTVVVPEGMDKNAALKVYMMVFNEEPQFFWMGSSVTINGGTIFMTYKADKSETDAMQQKIDANTAPVLAKVNAAPDTYSKLKIIYDYIVLNNDASVSSDGYNATIYNAFTDNGDIQCAGYAKAVQYLCDYSGIDSTVVIGRNNEGGSHAWNVVYCGDGYYNLDATWGDPVNNFDGRYIRYTYFLVTDKETHDISHLEVNSFYTSDGSKITCFTPPACTKTKYNYFIHEGLYYKDKASADAAIKTAIAKAVENRENSIQIRVSDEELFTELTSGTSVGAYLKYTKGLDPAVSGISKFTTATYKATGVITIEIKYKS